MDELVALVMKKTGLPKATAETAVKTVLDFLKKKLPSPVGASIDGFLSGKGQVAVTSASEIVALLDRSNKKKK